METTLPAIPPAELAQDIALGRFPVLIDVRREARYAEAGEVIRGACRRDPEKLAEWHGAIPAGSRIVVYCVHGHEVSQNAAQALRNHGRDAVYLAGGIEAWREAGLPLGKKPPARPSQWITRARPKIDRIACPWLVRRFIDPDAVIHYVPAESVRAEGQRLGAEPFDIPDTAYSHAGDLCSFDAFIARHGLGGDPALARLALIVRGADTDRLDLAPQSAGLLAMSLGLSAMLQDDDEMLAAAMPIYDALYAWCASASRERHAWQPGA